MKNSEKVKAAAKRVFDKLSKMDSEAFKALLETRTEGDVYKSMKELYSFDECGKITNRYDNKLRMISSIPSGFTVDSSSTNDYSVTTEPLWALAA
ncbi:MAG: hypothetical protein WGN25_01665 [Candidatus Electrothrix sp. GW3-4]|jgi:hypothetical protein|uniref:hypothetical protein n=1 Tax=Candidatus Electrothrix sp. GW3-4 TaxID=3126740 RepID=UPI002B2EA4A9|nr:MAG: hypothetical protein SD837_20115 [Candidatus Electrothrix sp. GW3-3]